jgi:hypothetical protein
MSMPRIEGWKLVVPLMISLAGGIYFVAIEPFRNPKKWRKHSILYHLAIYFIVLYKYDFRGSSREKSGRIGS